MSSSQGSHRAVRRGWRTRVMPPEPVAAPPLAPVVMPPAPVPRPARAVGSHGAGVAHRAVAAPAHSGAPAHARSLHDQLTIAVGMRRSGSVQVVHDPTVVDRRYTAPDRPSHAADRRAVEAGAVAAAGRHRRVAGGPEGLRRLVPQALVVVLLAGGTAAFLVHDKAVTLSIDGRPRVLHTFADDVREFLADEGVALGAHDSVVPAPGTTLDDGDEVAVRYAVGGGFPAGHRP